MPCPDFPTRLYLRPCTSFTDCEEEAREEVLQVHPVDGVTDNLYHFNFTGEVEVQWEESGVVGCEVCMVGREAGEAVSEGGEVHPPRSAAGRRRHPTSSVRPRRATPSTAGGGRWWRAMRWSSGTYLSVCSYLLLCFCCCLKS